MKKFSVLIIFIVAAILLNSTYIFAASSASEETPAVTYEYLASHLECRAENIYPGARVTLYADYFTDGAVPAGDTLKFQWYKNTVNSNEGGTKIELSEANSQGNAFIPNTSKVGTTYYYAILTYTPNGGTPILYKSDATEVTVKENPSTHPLAKILTPAEASGWMISTLSKDVVDFCELMAENSDGRIRVETVGTTLQGRPIPLVIIGKPAPAGPEEVDESKGIVLLNCNIHSGEVEGKEAMLIFIREVAMGLHDEYLDDLVILFTINHNPDGNDALGKNRNNTQYTPKLVGARTNAASGSSYYNINRDMTKLDTAEARALISVFNKWDPIAYVDEHGTNGTLQRHGLETHSGLNPDQDQDLAVYNRDYFTELALGSQSYFLEETGWVTAPYGDFSASRGNYSDGAIWWVGSDEYPRFTTNYVGMRNRISVLFEAYSHDPYTVRVDIQYYATLSFLKAVAQEKDTIKELEAKADAKLLARAQGLDPEKDVVTLRAERTLLDRGDGKNGTVTIKSYVANPTNNAVINYILRDDENDRSGTVYAGLREYQNVLNYGRFVPTSTVPLGAYYLLEADCTQAVEVLQAHGIEITQLTTPVTLNPGEYQWYSALTRTRSSSEGHNMNSLTGEWQNTTTPQVFPAGTYVISSAQILGNLAAQMMEPGSNDGLVAWNLVDNQMASYNGTVRANYTCTPSSGGTIAIPIFKVGSFDSLSLGNLNLTSDRRLVQAEEDFTLTASFQKVPNSNTAILNFTFDKDKFEYREFKEDNVVELLSKEDTASGVKLMVMAKDYNMDPLVSALFSVKEGVKNEDNKISLDVSYVVKEESGDKVITQASAFTTISTFELKIEDYTLITLSNLIDVFGMTSNDPKWSQWKYFDFNDSGDIDIYDFVYIAQKIK